MPRPEERPWYADSRREPVIYLLAAIFFLELIVGGVAFFYGLVHAAPELPGGPPVARFPALGWAVAALAAPLFLLLVVRLGGELLAGTAGNGEEGAGAVPPRVRSFYAAARNAPAVVLLAGLLGLVAALLLADGALEALKSLWRDLMPHLPWLAGSVCGLLAVLYIAHRWFVYRQRRMEEEYAYRREVLERTGMVLADKSCVCLPQAPEPAPPAAPLLEMPPAPALPAPDERAGKNRIEG